MKSLTEHLPLNIPARMDFLDITQQVEAAVERSGVQEGLCLVNAMHNTASVFLNDDEPSVVVGAAGIARVVAYYRRDIAPTPGPAIRARTSACSPREWPAGCRSAAAVSCRPVRDHAERAAGSPAARASTGKCLGYW